jgi:aldehyde dehydrogenase (NAD+)
VISFTGSTDVGLAIARAGGALGKRISLEMGGKNAVIVMDGRRPRARHRRHLVERVRHHRPALHRVQPRAGARERARRAGARVATRAKKLRLGDGLDPRPRSGRSSTEAGRDGASVRRDRRGEGALEAGGEPRDRGRAREGLLLPAHRVRRRQRGARIAVEEIFGPVLAMVKVKSLEEAVEVNNASRYGLSSSIFTADVNRAFRAMRDLDTGIVYVNHGTTGAETHLPFGGTRGTGNGHREAGHTMLDPSPSGRASTWISAGACSAPRSTT